MRVYRLAERRECGTRFMLRGSDVMGRDDRPDEDRAVDWTKRS